MKENFIDISHFYKSVVTMDDFWKDTIEGVRHLYITDFLLNKNI